MTDPKETIQQLLKVIGISRVIYVDDVFSASRETVTARCDALSIGDIAASGALPAVDFDVDDEDVARERVRRCIDGMDPNQIITAFARLATRGANGTANPDAEVVPKFVQLLAGFDLRQLSGNDWKKSRDQLLAEAPPAATLFVFDEDFSEEGYARDEGHRFIHDLHARLAPVEASYALLTHLATNNEHEQSLQKSIVLECPALRDRLIVVSKQRLSQEHEGFAWRMKLAVMSRLFADLGSQLRQAVAQACEAAGNEVDSLQVDAFERIVFRASSVEGAWAPETLVRIFGIHFEKSLFRSVRGDRTVHELAEKARQISQVETANTSEKTKAEARRLQRTAIYLDADDLNRLHLPIELGDVFHADDARFILIAQPCELMVREREGFRRNKESDERSTLALS